MVALCNVVVSQYGPFSPCPSLSVVSSSRNAVVLQHGPVSLCLWRLCSHVLQPNKTSVRKHSNASKAQEREKCLSGTHLLHVESLWFMRLKHAPIRPPMHPTRMNSHSSQTEKFPCPASSSSNSPKLNISYRSCVCLIFGGGGGQHRSLFVLQKPKKHISIVKKILRSKCSFGQFLHIPDDIFHGLKRGYYVRRLSPESK